MSSGLQANTFHAYCYGLLKRCWLKFDLIDEKDQFVYLRRRIAEPEAAILHRVRQPGKVPA